MGLKLAKEIDQAEQNHNESILEERKLQMDQVCRFFIREFDEATHSIYMTDQQRFDLEQLRVRNTVKSTVRRCIISIASTPSSSITSRSGLKLMFVEVLISKRQERKQLESERQITKM